MMFLNFPSSYNDLLSTWPHANVCSDSLSWCFTTYWIFLFLVLGAHIARVYPQQSVKEQNPWRSEEPCELSVSAWHFFFLLLEFSSMSDVIWNKLPHSEIPREAQWRATKMMKCFQNETLEEEVRNQTCSALCQERGEITINVCWCSGQSRSPSASVWRRAKEPGRGLS